jgi:hypothetical protein
MERLLRSNFSVYTEKVRKGKKGIYMTIAVIKISGLGLRTAEYLAQQGITTAEGLLEAGLEKLIAAPGFSEGRARKVMDAAATLVVDAEEAAEMPEELKRPVLDKKQKKKSGKKKKGKKEGRKKEKSGKKNKEEKRKPSKEKAAGKKKRRDKKKKKSKK